MIATIALSSAALSNGINAELQLPQILLIVHGFEFATHRVPVFLKSALSSRTGAVHLHVLCDVGGCRGFREAWRTHVLAEGLTLPGDQLSFLEEDGDPENAATSEEGDQTSAAVQPPPSLGRISEQRSRLPPRAAAFLGAIHPRCNLRGYGYLFLKLLSAELVPEAERILVLDPDVILLSDIANLWREFDAFDESQVLAMAVDQSDRCDPTHPPAPPLLEGGLGSGQAT